MGMKRAIEVCEARLQHTRDAYGWLGVRLLALARWESIGVDRRRTALGTAMACLDSVFSFCSGRRYF